MAITCRDILKLPTLKKMKIIAGLDSVDRIVRWVHVVDVPQVVDWVNKDELLFITGIGISNDTNALLKDLILAISAKNLSGLVINLGPYIKEIPKEIIDLADSLHFPVFELPWEVKLVEVTHAICSYIVKEQIEEKSASHLAEDLLSCNFDSVENIINRGNFFEYDLTKPSRVIAVDIDDFAGYIRKRSINNEERIHELKNRFKEVVLGVFERNNIRPLYILRSDSVILIVQENTTKKKNGLQLILEEIVNSVSGQLPGITASIGAGNCYSDLNDIKKSFKEAELALKVAKSMNVESVIYYKYLGLYRLLFKVVDHKELESFYQETLGELIEYDRLYKHDFMGTLNVYLNENCNLVKTSESLDLHRSTLKYRIKRIEEILRRDLGKSNDRIELQVGLLIGKFIDLSK